MDSESTDFVAAVYTHAAALLKRGLSPDDVRSKLQVDLHLPQEVADIVVSKLEGLRVATRRRAAVETMLGAQPPV